MWSPTVCPGALPAPQTSQCLRNSLRQTFALLDHLEGRASASSTFYLALPLQATWTENQLLADHLLNVQ